MTQAAPLALSQIGQIFVNVRDLKRAIAFYRDTLGMRFLFEAGNMAFFDCGGVRLMLGVASKPEYDHPSSILYYKVGDIQAAFDVVTSRGVQVEEEPELVARLPGHDLWMAFLRDPDDNVFALMSEVPRT